MCSKQTIKYSTHDCVYEVSKPIIQLTASQFQINTYLKLIMMKPKSSCALTAESAMFFI